MVETSSIAAQWFWAVDKGTLTEMMAGAVESTTGGGELQAVATPKAREELREGFIDAELWMGPFQMSDIPAFRIAERYEANIEALEKHLAALKAVQRIVEGDEDTSIETD